MHVLQPPPLRWLRLPLLAATLGLSCVCIAVGAQGLDRSSKLEKSILAEAQSTQSNIVFDMNDIKATMVVLTTTASLLALISLVFSVTLAFDWIRHAFRPQVKPGVNEWSGEETCAAMLPLSTRTLGFQTIALTFLTLWLFAILIPSTFIVRTHSAHLTVQKDVSMTLTPINVRYWDYGFLRCLAAAPWFSLVFSFPTSIVTWVAWNSKV